MPPPPLMPFRESFHNKLMQPLNLGSGQVRLKFAKKMFKDNWGLSQDGNEVGELHFTILRTKTSGVNALGEYTFEKQGKSEAVIRDGKTLASYEGKTDGHLTMADGTVYTVATIVKSSLPGSIHIGIAAP